ncbi:hypothetical protein Tco_0523539 [Tanacetum coccineum]
MCFSLRHFLSLFHHSLEWNRIDALKEQEQQQEQALGLRIWDNDTEFEQQDVGPSFVLPLLAGGHRVLVTSRIVPEPEVEAVLAVTNLKACQRQICIWDCRTSARPAGLEELNNNRIPRNPGGASTVAQRTINIHRNYGRLAGFSKIWMIPIEVVGLVDVEQLNPGAPPSIFLKTSALYREPLWSLGGGGFMDCQHGKAPLLVGKIVEEGGKVCPWGGLGCRVKERKKSRDMVGI